MASYNCEATELDEIHSFRKKYESISGRISEFEKIKQCCKEKDTVILAKNRSSVAALLAAEKFGHPIVLFFMNPYEIVSMLTFHNIFQDMLLNEANELRSLIGLSPIDNWLAWQSCPEIQIALWPEWFSTEMSEWPFQLKTIGFPLKQSISHSISKIPEEIVEILKEEAFPIIITGGTSKQIKRDFYKKAVQACEIIGKKTILVTRYEEFVPSILPSNVKWFKQVPLDDILPYMGAVIHHGGIGTVSGAIYAATPQLALAYHVDRPLNARRIKNLGIGEYLPPSNWDPMLIALTLKKILEPDYKKKCLNFRNELVEDNALDEICKIVENVAGKKEYSITHEKISRCATLVGHITTQNLDKEDKVSDKSNLLKSISPEMRELLLKKRLKQH